MNNKFEFMGEVMDAFTGLTSEKEIDLVAEQMIDLIIQHKEIAKKYLEAGIL